MRIAVVNEGSTKNRNGEILQALEGFDATVFNVGMKDMPGEPSLSYLETGIIAGVLLNLGAVDFVIGGCGSGQGFMNAALQFPNVSCGMIFDAVDMFLFSKVNAGNCISLSLNKGYGNLDGKLHLRRIFAELFSEGYGEGYPDARKAPQIAIRKQLARLSAAAHWNCVDICKACEPEVLQNAVGFPNVIAMIRDATPQQDSPQAVLKSWLLDFYNARCRS